MNWKTAFSQLQNLRNTEAGHLLPIGPVRSFEQIRHYLDCIHIKFCLLKPFFELPDYPLVEARELLPSFEPALVEYAALPGFSMVAFHRSLNYFNEVFQFDLLHTCRDPEQRLAGQACVLEESLYRKNLHAFLRHLPREKRDEFKEATSERQVSDIASYSLLINYLAYMDRAHVFSLDRDSEFYLSGIYASLPSDLDTELKRFGLKAKKFRTNDNRMYENNREFVYQFLMELYGFPISSERKTSAAIFARRLHRMGERFLIKVLGQSDRTLTSLYSKQNGSAYPEIEKVALVRVENRNAEIQDMLERDGFILDTKKRVVILKVTYRQHDFDINNVRQDRALSVLRQEIIHPLDGRSCTSVNVIKDSYTMSLKLNDIVRGEFSGKILYKGSEVVENTASQENRLKFLHAWLSKHQRRMIGYSDDFYAQMSQVLDSYLSHDGFQDDFSEHREVHQEVQSIYGFIKQARTIKHLEDLKSRFYKGKRISYLEMLRISTSLMSELRFEAVNYFDTLISNAIHFSDAILNDRYLINKYITQKDDHLTDNGLQIKKLYRRMVSLVDELKSIRKIKGDSQSVNF